MLGQPMDQPFDQVKAWPGAKNIDLNLVPLKDESMGEVYTNKA